ncbi:hypothetical protein FB381_3995 [Nocardioides albertanoniae]|uniref:Uncharacterized protein n=1 Tax=Nocardioides albertanoniae TaxID=1175486 RepID=A0A543ABX5_9ACTN|nr:hypothetical protein [Nocardioides albertanoniae]TQL70069.1 hypothetical protein FB381_3995 [Nocardioides albertanoniae]
MTLPVDCPEYLSCGHHWTKCAPGCPGWAGIEIDLPWWDDLEDELISRGLIARGLMTTPTSRTAARAGNSLGGAV